MQFVGACLLGIAWRYQKCIVLIGEGANGKSTLIDILRALFEASKVAAIPPNKLTDQYYVAELVGKVINLCAETPKSELRDSDKFKSVVTGDWTSGRAPYKPVAHFQPIAGHMFGCNTLPGTDDQSKGFWRRFVVVTFNRVFAEHEQSKTLSASRPSASYHRQRSQSESTLPVRTSGSTQDAAPGLRGLRGSRDASVIRHWALIDGLHQPPC